MVSALRRARLAFTAVSLAAAALAAAVGVVVAGVHAAHAPVLFATAAGATTVGTALCALLAGRLARRVPRHTVVELDLPTLPREARRSPLARLAGDQALCLQEVVDTIERAAGDARIDGLVVLPRFAAAGLAQIQELRDAIAAFRAAGKFAVAYADTFGEGTSGNAAYYLATACSELVLQPTGSLGLIGLAHEASFVRDALDRLHVEPAFEARREYKSAVSRLLEHGYTDPDREQQQRIVDVQLDQIVRAIATARQLEAAGVRRLVDTGPLLADEALAAGLVDRLAYHDELRAELEARTGRRDALLPLAVYRRRRPRRRRRSSATVALVTAAGPIVRRAGGPGPSPGGRPIDATRTAEAIRRAAESKAFKAIVLRLDSPGGSPVASDTIRRAITHARGAGTPVVVSMGNLAASGGYYVAAAANRIVAQPGTITGSIGVFAGKLVLKEAKARFGVTTDEVHAGAHALIASPNHGLGSTEHERLARSLDAVYADFLARVSDGRGLPPEAVEKVARGRVWTGADAAGNGLVDALGGFPAALAAVRDLIGLAPDAPLHLHHVPSGQPGLGPLILGRSGAGVLRALVVALLARLFAAAPRDLLGRPLAELRLEGDPEDWFVA